MRPLLAFAAVIASQACAQQLWNSTRAGMTKAQVQTAIGGATERVVDTLCGDHPPVTFTFDGDRLATVTVTSRLHPAGEGFINCVVSEYTSMFGKPVSDEPTATGREVRFVKDATVVKVTGTRASDSAVIQFSVNPAR